MALGALTRVVSCLLAVLMLIMALGNGHGQCAASPPDTLPEDILIPEAETALTSLHAPFKDAASLDYSFTVGKSGSKTWWDRVLGQLNGETFLSYSSVNNCHGFGVLGNRLNATKICENQLDTLKDGVDLIKQQVIHMMQENDSIREPLTLQARMCCWHEGDGCFNASWDIGLNGYQLLHFDSSTGKLTEVGPGSSRIKEMWEKDSHVIDFFKMTSRGDCRSWLEEIKLDLEKKLKPTASRNSIPDVNQQTLSLAIKPNISVLLIILTCSLLLLI